MALSRRALPCSRDSLRNASLEQSGKLLKQDYRIAARNKNIKFKVPEVIISFNVLAVRFIMLTLEENMVAILKCHLIHFYRRT